MVKGMVKKKSATLPTGTALQIYLLLVSSKEPMGVREIQTKIGLKSPSTVKYHLDRLRREGLVFQTPDGRYAATKADNPLTGLYLFVKNSPVPRLIPASISFTVFIVTYSILTQQIDPFIIGVTISFVIYIIIEGTRLRKLIRFLLGK